MELNIEKFSPTVAELQKLATEAKGISVTNVLDKEQVGEAHRMRMKLRGARTDITKIGKMLREDALAFQKAVIAKEKELVGIIEPEEERLGDLETDAQLAQEREERKATVPERMARIEALVDGEPFPGNEVLLDMDSPAFDAYVNERIVAKNLKEQEKIEAGRKALDEERENFQREKDLEAAREQARKEEREKAEREAKEKQEREERERQEKEARDAREQAQMRKNERIRAFLVEMGWTEELEAQGKFRIERLNGGESVVLWKRVGTFESGSEEI